MLIKRIKKCVSCVLALLLCTSLHAKSILTPEVISPQQKYNELFLQKNLIKEVFNDRKFSVVRILSVTKAQNNDKDIQQSEQTTAGTGFFVSDRANVITSASIVGGASSIWIEYNGLTYPAECIGIDESTRIAVIRPLQMPEKFNFVDISSNTSDQSIADTGEIAIFIGCKFELDPSVDIGIISGKHISYNDFVFLTTYLRSTLESVGGEGGAPIFDINGDLIGVIIAALPELKSSFILPKRALNRIYDDIIAHGKVKYGSIGIEIHAEYKLGIGQQIILSRVTPESSANKCGLQSGDIILKMNNFRVSYREDVYNALFFAKPNSVMHIDVMRGEQILHLECKIEPASMQ